MAKTKDTELPEDLQQALKQIVDEFETEERSTRQRQIRLWKRLEYYWAGFTRIWWDDTAHDWRIFDDGYGYGDDASGQGYYDKSFNVFRGYLESIIAALSSSVPQVKCIPDDADSASDLITARGGTKIAELIYKHNDAPLLWIKGLWVYCTQGMIAAYNHTVENKKFGTYDKPVEEEQEETAEVKTCPICKMQLPEDVFIQALQMEMQEADEFDPDDEDSGLHDILNKGAVICPQCQVSIDPDITLNKFTVTRITGTTKEPKSRQKIEVYGGLFVKVPNWARSQEDTPYLGYAYETHYTNVYKEWPHLRETLKVDSGAVNSDGNEMYDRWGRLSPQYYSEYPPSTPTVRHWWLRASAFEAIKDDKIRKQLQTKFPDGVKVVWVNEQFAEARNEALDDHWTLTYNPLSEYIHFDPLGLLVTSVQEITQDLTSLTLQTIEHGIPQTFADSAVLDFDEYNKVETAPGFVYPVKPKSGKSIADAFHTISTATLGQEVMPFGQQVQSLAQFVSGALPSLFGGQAERGSETASEYSMSRNQALQRLQTTWKMINYWWQDIFMKVIPAYIKTMQEDERIVKRVAKDKFINEMIIKSELDGKIGSVEAESLDTLPMTFGQIRDMIMQLIETNNPQILEILGSAENLGAIQMYLGLDKLQVPGEKDREKQFEEIEQLVQAAPTQEINPQTGQPEEMPSVMPDFEVDDHKIEADICRSWLVGESGRQAKVINSEGYKNVLLHMKIHIMMLQQLSMGAPQPQPQGSGEPNNEKLRPMDNSNAG